MKKLETSGDVNASLMDRYLVERASDVQRILEQVVLEHSLTDNKKVFGVDQLPQVYPYVVLAYADQENDFIDLSSVTLIDFENLDVDSKDHLFELVIRRKDLDSPYTEREHVYQVPAKDIFKAMVELGQEYHKDDMYDLEVVSWKQVH